MISVSCRSLDVASCSNERHCIMSYCCEFDRSSHSRCKLFLYECQQYKRAIHICPKDFCCIYWFLAVGATELPYWLYVLYMCLLHFVSFLWLFSSVYLYVCLSVLPVSVVSISVKSNFIHILFLPLNSLTVFQISPESLPCLTSPHDSWYFFSCVRVWKSLTLWVFNNRKQATSMLVWCMYVNASPSILAVEHLQCVCVSTCRKYWIVLELVL